MFSSFGIRASALDFERDLQDRRRERQQSYERVLEESRKIFWEQLKESEKEKEIKEQVEQEKKARKI